MEIVLQNIGKQFKNGTRALDHVTFTIPQGEFVSVIGPSGAGKTTLFRILNGMETPGDGTVLFDGSDISSMSGTARKNVKRSIGTIYQDFCLVENSTCLANVLTACLPDMGFFPAVFGIYGKERRAEALKFLDRVGLPEKADEPVKISPVVRNSAPPSREPSCVIQKSCWLTSPPRLWTRSPGGRF